MAQIEQFISGSGLLDSFFTLLWKQNEVLENQNIRYNFIMPHTIIFKDSNPVQWYFSNKDNKIKRKKLESMTVDHILEVFT